MTSLLLRIGAVVLALTSVAAGVGGWIGLEVVETTLTVAPELGRAAEPSEGLIEEVGGTLDEVREGLGTLERISGRIGASTGEVAGVVDEVAELATGRMPDALASLEAALPALIDTTAVIDDTMRALSVLGVDYRPQVPLDEAFADVLRELEGLPESIRRQGESLDALAGEMEAAGEDTRLLTDQIGEIEQSLARTQSTLEGYAASLDELGVLAEGGDRIRPLLGIGRAAMVVLIVSGLALGTVGWLLAGRLPDRVPPSAGQPPA